MNARRLAVLSFGFATSVSQAQSCSVSAGALAFGAYDPTRSTSTESRADIVVRCSAASTSRAATVTVDVAMRGTVDGTRRLGSGAQALRYAIYQDASLVRAWSDDAHAGGSVLAVAGSGTGTGGELHLQAFGRIPPHQWLPPATYADAVTVEITY